MGCRQSRAKVSHEAVDEMADSKKQYSLPEPEPPAPTDPRLPLTARQVFKLKKSWKGIKRNMEMTGVEMFIRLFKVNSDLKKLFTNFKDMTNEESLRENEELEKHALLVMNTMDEAISNIDNVDYVYDVLHRTGKSHGKFTGFIPDLFQQIKSPTDRGTVQWITMWSRRKIVVITNATKWKICKPFMKNTYLKILKMLKAPNKDTLTLSKNCFFFAWMEIPFLESVKLTLGDRYTDNMDVIYKITIKFILQTVRSGHTMDIS